MQRVQGSGVQRMQGVQRTHGCKGCRECIVQRCRGAGVLSAGRSDSAGDVGLRGAESAGVQGS